MRGRPKPKIHNKSGQSGSLQNSVILSSSPTEHSIPIKVKKIAQSARTLESVGCAMGRSWAVGRSCTVRRSCTLNWRMGLRHSGHLVLVPFCDNGEIHFRMHPSPNMCPQGSLTGRSGCVPERNGSWQMWHSAVP